MIKNIPNLLSIFRLITIPIVAWLLLIDVFFYAALFTILIAVSDFLDGFIARSLKAESELGSYLDAIADKAFVISIYILIGTANLLPVFIIILVIARDIIILGSFVITLFAGIKIKLKTSKVSKWNTFFQFFLVIATLLGNTAGFENLINETRLIELLIGIVVITTLISLFIYIRYWMESIN